MKILRGGTRYVGTTDNIYNMNIMVNEILREMVNKAFSFGCNSPLFEQLIRDIAMRTGMVDLRLTAANLCL